MTLSSHRRDASPDGRAFRAGLASLDPFRVLPALLALALLSLPPDALQDTGGAPPAKAPPPAAATGQEGAAANAQETAPPVERARYHSQDELDSLLSRWEASGLVERVSLGESAGGRPLVGVVVSTPGPVPAVQRTTVLVVGGLDGVSSAGTEAAIGIVEHLLAHADQVPPSVAVVVVPWANPDGLARPAAETLGDGHNATAVDDDQDGRVDEDGPDDVDGDGEVLSMLVLDPEGPYARAQDGRFLRPARPGDAERWRLVPEGRDDDGDGRYNEDPPGGVSLERNFPLGWRPAVDSGPWPLSEPETRALAELVLARRVAVALLLDGNHGGIWTPGASAETRAELAPYLALDAPAYAALGRMAGGGAGEAGALSSGPPDEERPGAPCDWLYAGRGILAAEVALWGPDRGGSEPGGADVQEGAFRGPDDPLAGVPAGQRAWARWLDDTRGGIGYVDWQPVELGDGRRALVGGWEPHTFRNPPEELLGGVIAPAGPLVLDLIAGLPDLAVEVEELSRDAEIVTLALRVENHGALPSGVGPLSSPEDGLALSLVLPEGARLVAGEAVHHLGHLAAGAISDPLTWLIQAKEHAVARVELTTRWGGKVVQEVRL